MLAAKRRGIGMNAQAAEWLREIFRACGFTVTCGSRPLLRFLLGDRVEEMPMYDIFSAGFSF